MSMANVECLFCDFDNSERNKIIVQDDLIYARLDNFPVSPGHVEVVPKRHVESMFELTDEEMVAIYHMLRKAKGIIDSDHHPDAYNLGLNDGRAAGRTIDHCHFHLIPRYEGDVENPRGGIRHIIPGKGSY
jgi:diadenosine tetraphosphate (Ap4A) HIT family hydrolase